MYIAKLMFFLFLWEKKGSDELVTDFIVLLLEVLIVSDIPYCYTYSLSFFDKTTLCCDFLLEHNYFYFIQYTVLFFAFISPW